MVRLFFTSPLSFEFILILIRKINFLKKDSLGKTERNFFSATAKESSKSRQRPQVVAFGLYGADSSHNHHATDPLSSTSHGFNHRHCLQVFTFF